MESQIRNRYTVIVYYDQEDARYYATIPTLDLMTQAFDVEQAFERADELIAGHLLTMEQLGEPVPVEDQPVHVRQLAGVA